MKIDCVTICVGFSDVLAHSLPLNKRHFDSMVVVSDTKDVRTHNLCAHHHIRVVQTDHFYADQQAFNKGNGINGGLEALGAQDWICHLDADIVLPPRTRELLEKVDLDPAGIYGIDRMMCPSFEDWTKFVQTPTMQHTVNTFIIPEPFPIGPRVGKLDADGYVPIGFFQLWNAAQTGIGDYPAQHGTAGRSDMLHAMRWSRRNRHLLPEIIAIHLEGRLEPGVNNWRGRRADWFGPEPLPAPCPPGPGCYDG